MELRHKKILGIDLHDYSAELVEITNKNGKAFLESYNRILLPSSVIENGEIKEPKTLEELIRKLTDTSHPSPIKSKKVAIIFPSSKVLTHIFTFPAILEENDIKKAIPYEAETLIPFSINDIYWDYVILDKQDLREKHPSQHILFACITKEIADSYAKTLENAGLIPVLFGINIEALKFATTNQTENTSTSLIIDIGTLSVNYLILKRGQIKYYFSSNNAGYRLTNKITEHLHANANAIFEKKEQKKLTSQEEIKEIELFIENSFKRGENIIKDQESIPHIGSIEKVLLTGEFLNFPEFYSYARKYFSGKKIEVVDPVKNLYIEPKKKDKINNSPNNAPSLYFTYSIGIAQRAMQKTSYQGINLLPDRLKESFSKRKTVTLLSFASIVMTVLTMFMATFSIIQFQNMDFERMNLEIKKSAIEKTIYGTRYQEIHESIEKLNNEIYTLEKINNSLFCTPCLLREIHNLFPTEVSIKDINFIDTELSVVINGISPTREKLLETQKKLENAEFIEEVIAPISNYDEKSQISFLIQIKLNFTKLQPYGYTDA